MSDWEEKFSNSRQRPYFFNKVTGESVWDRPADFGLNNTGSTKQVQVLHLLVKHAGSRRPASWRNANIQLNQQEAEQELLNIRQVIIGNNDADPSKSVVLNEEAVERFKQLSSQRSDCSSAKRGGDLGFFGRGQMQKPFEEASFALHIHEMSPLVWTDSGAHIILRVA